MFKVAKRRAFYSTFQTSNTINLTSKLRELCSRNNVDEAITLFYTIDTPPSPHDQIYATLFSACARNNLISHGVSLHNHMITHLKNDVNLFTINHLINMYAKWGFLDTAQKLFDEMSHRNIVSWTVLVSGYAQHGFSDECFSMFSEMLGFYRPTEFALSSVLSACGEKEKERVRGRQVHALVLKVRYDAYVYVANALITMYFKRFMGDYEGEAWRVFEEMEFRNLISWNSMIAGFQLRGFGTRAINLFSQMRHIGIGFDRSTILSLLSSISAMDEKLIDLGLKYCYNLHALFIKAGFMSNIEVATALVKCYSNLGGEFSDCHKIFLETSGHRDLVSWTGIISAFAERDPEEAISLFSMFRQEEDLNPDGYTFSIVIKACASLATERHAMAVHSQIIKAGFEDDTVLANSLIHTYARCGSIALSKHVFDELRIRDTVSWNSMLKAYALHGQAKESINLFKTMDLGPDSATFVALLSSCSHAGMVEEGTKIFNTMFEKHGVTPQIDHFACMVDILGRVGRISEAEELIRTMPLKPDLIIWSTLLGACRKHNETQIAKLASSKLNELDPENSLGYVQISNLYSSTGSFNKAGLIRKEMENCKVRKEPGLSWIEIGNRKHEFASGGRRHPQKVAIFSKLEEIIKKLKVMGYLPNTGLALHDIEEEHKEEQLYYHSEKLALVFAIMNLDSLGFRSIKIMKNIRICVDCHDFMKLSSQLFQREIVVRDSNRFHHFKNQGCSCNDFW